MWDAQIWMSSRPLCLLLLLYTVQKNDPVGSGVGHVPHCRSPLAREL